MAFRSLDILWLNEKGLELAPEMEEIGIDSKSVTIDDEGGEVQIKVSLQNSPTLKSLRL